MTMKDEREELATWVEEKERALHERAFGKSAPGALADAQQLHDFGKDEEFSDLLDEMVMASARAVDGATDPLRDAMSKINDYIHGIIPAAIPELRTAFITLNNSGGAYSIVMKFNQKTDAFAVHDFLLKGGGKEHRAPTAQAGLDVEALKRAFDEIASQNVDGAEGAEFAAGKLAGIVAAKRALLAAAPAAPGKPFGYFFIENDTVPYPGSGFAKELPLARERYAQVVELFAAPPLAQAPAVAVDPRDVAAQDFLKWNRSQEIPPVAIPKELGVARKVMELLDTPLKVAIADREDLERRINAQRREISRLHAVATTMQAKAESASIFHSNVTKRFAELQDELADAHALLRQMVLGSAGHAILQKLADGQGTETEDGKAWLAAKALVEKVAYPMAEVVTLAGNVGALTAGSSCPSCNGNDSDAPCAYPSEDKPGCLRDIRRGAADAGNRSAIIQALKGEIPLVEPVYIGKALRAGREACVVLNNGTEPLAAVHLVNIGLTGWTHTKDTAEAFANGYNLALKQLRATLLEMFDHSQRATAQEAS